MPEGATDKGRIVLQRYFPLPLIALAFACAQPVVAQETGATDEALPPADTETDVDIVVTAERLPGQLDTDVPPVDELDEADIEALGAGSITELVAALTPQTSSARGRGGGQPIFLVNGIRIGSFREFRSYPPEAIAKVEVFPEEVAQRFGFSPDRRVINFVLKPDFQSREVEVEYEQPDRGGYSRNEQEFTLLKITDGGRLNLNLEFADVSLLTEGERGVVQAEGSTPDLASDPDPADFRSLVPDSAQIEATANWARSFIDSGSSVSLNATFLRNESRSLSGLDTVLLTAPDGTQLLRSLNRADPLERRTDTETYSTAGSYTRPLGAFQLTGTFDVSFIDSFTEIDRRADTTKLVADVAAGRLAVDAPFLTTNDAGFDVATSRVWDASSLVTLRGSPLLLPGGELSTTFDFGYDWTRISSDDTRTAGATRLTRGDLSGGVNVVVPLTSRREAFADALGSISLTGQAGVDHLSDFGTLYDWSAGVNWSPFGSLDLQATYTWREIAPGLTQLGSPVVDNLNVPVFDLQRGETVLATIVTGGNPDLAAETQTDWRFTANWELPFIDNARLRVDYIRNRSRGVTSGFPILTAPIEAAFPDRVTRAADGTLLAIDRRPVTFAETRAERLAFGLVLRGSVGKARPQQQGGEDARGGARRGPPGQARGAGPGDADGDRRARFIAFREAICGEGGEDRLMQLVDAVERGEMPEGAPEGFDLAGAQRMLERFRNEDGSYDRERLKQFLPMMCGGMGPAAEPGGGASGDGPGAERRARFAAFRERLCADDGQAFLLRLVEAIERGEELPEMPEGFDAAGAQQLLDRFRKEDGTIDRERLEQFRTGICSRAQSGSQAGQGGARRGGGGPGFGRRGDGRGRYFLSLTHSIELDNEVLVAPGGPLLDQLAGQGLSSTGFPRHTSRLEGGLFWNGWGMRVSGRYTGKARVLGSGAPGSTDLFFDDLATIDLRLFADIGQLTDTDSGFLKGFRVSLRADNIFDGRRQVTDANGETPLAFQPFLVDPTGRYLGIDLRKVF